MAQNPSPQPQKRADRLKALADASGPCISIYFPIHTPTADFRKPSKLFERSLLAFANSLPGAETAALLAPVHDLAAIADSGVGNDGGTLVVFRSPDIIQYFLVNEELDESFTAGAHFFVRPVLGVLTQNKNFKILALSQNRVRLLQCDDKRSAELALPQGAPRSFQEFLETRAAPEVEMSAPGSFTSATDRDKMDFHLANFYRAVNAALVSAFKDPDTPLVLAGVEYEIPIYRKVNTYKTLVEQPVPGAPDGMKGGELHKRALEIMERYWEKPLSHALDQYEKNAPARVSTSVKTIVQGAHDGRVLHLLVAREGKQPGAFDEPTHKVRLLGEHRTKAEDLINAAVLKTVSHGGDVHVCPRERIPRGAGMAAVFRW